MAPALDTAQAPGKVPVRDMARVPDTALAPGMVRAQDKAPASDTVGSTFSRRRMWCRIRNGDGSNVPCLFRAALSHFSLTRGGGSGRFGAVRTWSRGYEKRKEIRVVKVRPLYSACADDK
ncbi:hypothetical protein BWQ96_03792 [Gracilariopsis chorda]|uniref:Uncharacterized protein n=1 Tax=Gracilariopsis chorda TaxID=448386 RepID=A0A2V3IXP9_9FLOR|nr:hypothetical protein BWQ96_03792 [Gracilariopsis chorda]|eukprot:PXF46467.1 hypothetical protein BWQ96_03792 [Gracilariopsis chorda]